MLIEGYINFNSVNTQISGCKKQNITSLPLKIVKSYMNKLYGISVETGTNRVKISHSSPFKIVKKELLKI